MEPQTPPLTIEINQENKEVQPVTNTYTSLRKIFFVLVILFFSVLMLFLIYQNGKSIYDNGL